MSGAPDEQPRHVHAERTIGERPEWPKHLYIVDAIPPTTMGKIYKPQLRCEAAARLAQTLLREQFDQAQISSG